MLTCAARAIPIAGDTGCDSTSTTAGMIRAVSTISRAPSDVDVGQADRSRKSFIDKAFHRGPGLGQRDSLVVDDRAVRVAGILVIAGLERERGVHQIQIDRVQTRACSDSPAGRA